MSEAFKTAACESECGVCRIIWKALEVVGDSVGATLRKEAGVSGPVSHAEAVDWREHFISAVMAWVVAQGIAAADGNILNIIQAFGAAMAQHGGLKEMEVREKAEPEEKPPTTH